MNPLQEVNPSKTEGPYQVNENLNGGVLEQAERSRHITEGSSAISNCHVDRNFTDSVHSKHRAYYELPAAKISELMELNSLQSASSRSLFTTVNNILEESIDRTNSDIPQPVSSLLKLIVQEIEQRALKQGENLKKQSLLYKSREERYRSRIKALETLSMGTAEENEVVMHQLQQIKSEKARIDEERNLEKQELSRLVKEKVNYEIQISSLKQELVLTTKAHEENCLQLNTLYVETKDELEKKIIGLECILADSEKRVKELEDFSESKYIRWKKKELGYKRFIDSHVGFIKDLRKDFECLKQEVLKTKRFYMEEINNFELEIKGLVDAAQNYHTVLTENRKLFNEVQDLKGNIRVYCRVRPFHQGQSKKQTTIEYIGENGELVVANPLKQGKDTHRVFKFNKVFSPTATQEDVFADTRPLIRSVLDGYNVCIFAYGQTGSGKTFTMTGPSLSSVEEWGVNYRALNDLFNISQSRKSSIKYEVGVQMVEIYNEQVRDLLINESSQKNLGILNSTQSNGLVVPDASMHEVKSTTDVLELMNIGLLNRAIGATALNERSSRSHSVLTVHVKGTELETRAILHGCLHLVDLAGSERVDRSEATGDRLREAQHINKSLSALGDVISALAQRSPHIPYRNSKLTQLLQSSLGGQAKTLMFVQLNPDVESYSETLSSLKFAERVSGVELGAARINTEGRGLRELMEQVAFLQDTISKKDEEIGQLRKQQTNFDVEKSTIKSSQSGSASLRRTSSQKTFNAMKNTASKVGDGSELIEKYSESIAQLSTKYFKHPNESFQESGPSEELQSWSIVADEGVQVNEEVDLLGSGDSESGDKLSEMSDGVMSMATETDGSTSIVDEYTLFLETAKPSPESAEKHNIPAKLPRPPQKHVQSGFSRLSLNNRSSKVSSSKKSKGGSSSAVASSKRWQ